MTTSPPTLRVLLSHESLVRRLARSLLRNADDADDLAQETWLAATTKPPAALTSPRGWLARVMRNKAASTLRRRSARQAAESTAAVHGVAASSEEIVAREEIRRRVLQELLRLDDRYRSALLLRFYENLPPRDVARHLGVPIETARTRIKRGLAQLRARLDALHDGDRRRWQRALAPWAAGSAVATGTGASLTWLFVAVPLLAVAGVAITLHVTSTDAPQRRIASTADAPDGETGPQLQTSARTHTRTTERPPPEAEPSGEEPEPDAYRSLTGVVTDAERRPIQGAYVYAVPARLADKGMLPGLPRKRTDERGRAELNLDRDEGWVVRAFKHGYRTAEVPLAPTVTGPVAFELQPAATLRITLRQPDGTPPGGVVHMRLISLVERPTDSVPYGGDYAIRPDLTHLFQVPPEGELTIGVTVPRPARLQLEQLMKQPWAMTGYSMVIGETDETVDAVIRPSGRIGIRVFVGNTDDPPRLHGLPRYTLHDDATGDVFPVRFGYRDGKHVPGAMDLVSWTAIPQGIYTLRIRARGFAPWSQADVVVRAGETTSLPRVALRPDATRIHVTTPSMVATKGSIYVATRRSGRAWTSARLAMRDPDVLSDWFVEGLDPGTYELMAWMDAGHRVGYVPSVTVRAGETQRVTMAASAGVRPALERTAVTFERVEVRGTPIGALPLVAFQGDRSAFRFSDFAWMAPGPETKLGPYPVAAVEVRTVDWHGTVRTQTASR